MNFLKSVLTNLREDESDSDSEPLTRSVRLAPPSAGPVPSVAAHTKLPPPPSRLLPPSTSPIHATTPPKQPRSDDNDRRKAKVRTSHEDLVKKGSAEDHVARSPCRSKSPAENTVALAPTVVRPVSAMPEISAICPSVTESAPVDDRLASVDPWSTAAEMKGELRACSYYHGFLPRKDAEDLLAKKHEFLLRKSDRPGIGITVILSLRLEDKKDGEVLPDASTLLPVSGRAVDHVAVHRDHVNKRWAIRDREWFLSIDELLHHYATRKIPIIEDDARYIIRNPIARMNYLLRHTQVLRFKKIGQGAFGEVFKGQLKIDDERCWDVAIKCLPEGIIVSKEQREDFIAEARTNRKLNHKNIIRLRGVAIDEMPLMMVLEWAENGSMLDVLRKRSGELTLIDKQMMLVHAACGMRYLEKKNVIHRDVAARNCLMDKDMVVKISDFGLSRISACYKERAGGKRPIRWLAPESIANYVYTTKSDVFAFGVLMWEAYENGKQPFSDMRNQEIANGVVKHGMRLDSPKDMPHNMVMLMRQAFRTTPANRPSFHTIREKVQSEHEAMIQRKSKGLGWLRRG